MRNFHQVDDLFSGEKAFATLSYGWLWAGLYFILVTTKTIAIVFCQCFERHCFHKTLNQVIIVGVTSLFGYIEVITSTLVSIKPSYARCLLQRVYNTFSSQAKWFDLSVYYCDFTPGSSPWLPFLCWPSSSSLILFSLRRSVVFRLICWFWWNCFFLQGGIHIYHLLTTYIASWPTLLFSLLTVSRHITTSPPHHHTTHTTHTTTSPPTSPPGQLSSSLFSPWVAVMLLIFSLLILVYLILCQVYNHLNHIGQILSTHRELSSSYALSLY